MTPPKGMTGSQHRSNSQHLWCPNSTWLSIIKSKSHATASAGSQRCPFVVCLRLSLATWMIFKASFIATIDSFCSSSKLRSAAAKCWFTHTPPLLLLGSSLALPHKLSAERSAMGEVHSGASGQVWMLALVKVRQSGAIHVVCSCF